MNSNYRWLILIAGLVMLAAIGALLFYQMSNKPVITPAEDDLHRAIVAAREEQLKNIVGIGVALIKSNGENGQLKISQVMPNSPAEKAGLDKGLEVLKIDGMSTEGMRLEESVARLRGSEGTKVKLELRDPITKTTNFMELIRRKVKV